MDLRRAEAGLVAREQGGAPGLEVGALGQDHEFRGGQLATQGRHQGPVATDPADQQEAAEDRLRLLQEGHDLVGHAVVERVQHVLDPRLLAIQLVGDVGLAVDRASRSQGNRTAMEGTLDRLIEAESHPADLLHEELPAPRGALVVRKHRKHTAVAKQIDQEGLPPEGNHAVACAAPLLQGTLKGRDLRDRPLVPADSDESAAGRRQIREHPVEDLARAPPMSRHAAAALPLAQHHQLHGKRTQIDPHIGGARPFTRRVRTTIRHGLPPPRAARDSEDISVRRWGTNASGT